MRKPNPQPYNQRMDPDDHRRAKLQPVEEPATVAILGGNPVIGKAMEWLLHSTAYVARFFSDFPHLLAGMIGKLTNRLGRC